MEDVHEHHVFYMSVQGVQSPTRKILGAEEYWEISLWDLVWNE